MPIYEFRCLKCEDLFELLLLKTEDQAEMRCPKCQSEEFERVMSTTNYSMNGARSGGAAKSQGSAEAQTRTCSGGSCTTYNIPGPA